jgi:hypothetical protein
MIRQEPSMVTEARAFDRHRPLLFSIAYRMLGSVMDAEDVVQEAYLQRGDTVARGLPLHRRQPALHRPAPLREGTARAVRRAVAAGAPRDRRGC